MAFLILADGTRVKMGKLPSFQDCQSMVNGMVELVRVNKDTLALVNEEGILMGLPYNKDASNVCGQSIVGNAVILETAEEVQQVLGD